MKPIEVGDPASEFTATASDGRPVSLAGFKGKQAVVLFFFYPRDNSPICTKEACGTSSIRNCSAPATSKKPCKPSATSRRRPDRRVGEVARL